MFSNPGTWNWHTQLQFQVFPKLQDTFNFVLDFLLAWYLIFYACDYFILTIVPGDRNYLRNCKKHIMQLDYCVSVLSFVGNRTRFAGVILLIIIKNSAYWDTFRVLQFKMYGARSFPRKWLRARSIFAKPAAAAGKRVPATHRSRSLFPRSKTTESKWKQTRACLSSACGKLLLLCPISTQTKQLLRHLIRAIGGFPVGGEKQVAYISSSSPTLSRVSTFRSRIIICRGAAASPFVYLAA